MIILIAWEHTCWNGGAFIDAMESVLIPLGIATALVLLVRILKKRGMLSEHAA